MKPKIRVLTLAVADLETSLAFYRDGLGLPTEGVVGTEFEHGAVAFFNLDDSLMLALWPREYLARDSNLSPGPTSPTDFSIGHNVGSKAEVDAVMAEAERAGARITVAPRDTFWGGYSGYFQDLDGHLWEVVWNPDLA
jgi:catechol 2,3-dioxygenase-like lactoylglutathione lyase family enzyme